MTIDNYTTSKDKRRFHIGKCIYCGATEDLRIEHCFPESLNGEFELEAASCRECEKITGKFEARFTRETLLPMRTAWNMKSKRSKSKRPKEFPMEFIKDGQSKVLNVPVDEHCSVIPLLELGPTGKYPNEYHAKGLRHSQFQVTSFQIRSQEHVSAIIEKYDADEFRVHFPLYIEDFLRMIAKIAYCFAVARFGLKNIAEVYVLPAILGQSNDIWHWVGGDGTQELYHASKHMNVDHVVNTWTEEGEIHARVKLLKKSETPEYKVIIGRLSDAARGVFVSAGFKHS
jgi:hypothetical protein